MTAFYSADEASFSIRILREKVYDLLTNDKRLDGRSPLDMREITIETNVIEKAEGSAMVSMGGTKILVGVKAEIGRPFSDRPDDGTIAVNAELLPLASKAFEPGPPSQEGIELARVVDRCIRESKAVDLGKLCLVSGEKVYVVFIDVYVLDYDGNYFDPSVISAVAALATARLPKYKVVDGDVERVEGTIGVPLATVPLSITMGLVKDKLLVDPSLMEASSLDTSITVAFDSEETLVAIQKSKSGYIPFDAISRIVSVAKDRTAFIRTKFKESVEIG